MASKVFSTSLRRLHQQHRLYSSRHSPSMDAYTKNPFGVANNLDGQPRKVFWRRAWGERVVVMRVDLPGLISEGLKLWVNEERDIAFEGKMKSEPEYEYEGGSYHGIIPVLSKMCDMEEFKADVKHGVLWVTIPLTEDAKVIRKIQLDLMEKGLVKY